MTTGGAAGGCALFSLCSSCIRGCQSVCTRAEDEIDGPLAEVEVNCTLACCQSQAKEEIHKVENEADNDNMQLEPFSSSPSSWSLQHKDDDNEDMLKTNLRLLRQLSRAIEDLNKVKKQD